MQKCKFLEYILDIDLQKKSGFITENQKESPTELAFKYAVFKINKAKDVLPNNSLTYDIQYVPNEDSFRTTKKVHFVKIF